MKRAMFRLWVILLMLVGPVAVPLVALWQERRAILNGIVDLYADAWAAFKKGEKLS
jgi:hypothetical protein